MRRVVRAVRDVRVACVVRAMRDDRLGATSFLSRERFGACRVEREACRDIVPLGRTISGSDRAQIRRSGSDQEIAFNQTIRSRCGCMRMAAALRVPGH